MKDESGCLGATIIIIGSIIGINLSIALTGYTHEKKNTDSLPYVEVKIDGCEFLLWRHNGEVTDINNCECKDVIKLEL